MPELLYEEAIEQRKKKISSTGNGGKAIATGRAPEELLQVRDSEIRGFGRGRCRSTDEGRSQ